MSKNRMNMSVVIAVVLMLFVAVLVAVRQNRGQRAEASADNQLLTELDLGNGPFAEAVVGEFMVTGTAVTHLHFSLQNLDTPIFSLKLQADDGTLYTILQAENYRTNRDGGGDWQETLLPGRYQLLLTAAQSTGLVTIYHRSQPAN